MRERKRETGFPGSTEALGVCEPLTPQSSFLWDFSKPEGQQVSERLDSAPVNSYLMDGNTEAQRRQGEAQIKYCDLLGP